MEQVPLANLDGAAGSAERFGEECRGVVGDAGGEAAGHCGDGAEFCTALDNSCLMHLGGAMHRQYAG